MAIDISEFPEFNWPLVAALGVVAALVVYVIYQAINNTGAGTATKAAGDLAATAGGAAEDVLKAGEGVIDTLTGGGDSTPGNASNGTLFYQGIQNFFSTGSIYGSN
jgi:hypothetical protein